MAQSPELRGRPPGLEGARARAGMPSSSAVGSVLHVGPLALRAVNLVGTCQPYLRGVVVLLQDVAQPVGTVGAQPRRFVQVAQQGVSVADVLRCAR